MESKVDFNLPESLVRVVETQQIDPEKSFRISLEKWRNKHSSLESQAERIFDHPFSMELPTQEIRDQLKEKYGLEPMGRIIVPIEISQKTDLQMTTMAGEPVDADNFLEEHANWLRVPIGQGYEENEKWAGYVWSLRSQGRSGSDVLEEPLKIEGHEGIFHDADLKGNGLGGDSRKGQNVPGQTIFHFAHRNSQGGITADSEKTAYGLLNEPEAEATLTVEEINAAKWRIRGEAIIGVVKPKELPESDKLPTGFHPVILERLWRNATSFAEILAGAFQKHELHRAWGTFLGNPTLPEMSISINNKTDEENKMTIDKIREAARPIISRMKKHYQEEYKREPSNEELFQWFYQNHISNYKKLIEHDLVHGALHQQNVKVEAEWGDKVTLFDNENLTERVKNENRVKDFFDCYESVILMAVALHVSEIPGFTDFYHLAVDELKERNSENFPDVFNRFINQDVGAWRSGHNIPEQELIELEAQEDTPDKIIKKKKQTNKDAKIRQWILNLDRLKMIRSPEKKTKKDEKEKQSNPYLARRLYNSVFFYDDSFRTIREDGVLSERIVDDLTFQVFRSWEGNTSGRIIDQEGNEVDFYSDRVKKALLNLDKKTR